MVSILDQQVETYAGWAATKFSSPEMSNGAISGPEADPDRDGGSNFMEFALNGDPKSAASLPLPGLSVESVPGEPVQLLRFNFTRRPLATGVRYTVQHSTDFATWQDGATFQGATVTSDPALVQLVSATGSPLETRTVRAATPIAPGQRVWLRLQVKQQ